MKHKHWFLFRSQRNFLHLCSHSVAYALNNSSEALNMALAKVAEEDSITNELKLEFLKSTVSSKGKTWRFVFRSGDIQYTVEMNDKGGSKLNKKSEERENNAEFWATLPKPQEIESDIDYLERAKKVANDFNTKFKAQDRAIIEYHTCDAPREGEVSKFKNGCKNDKLKQWWEVIVQVKIDTETSFRKIEFQNGQPVILSRVLVSGNW